MSQTCLGCERAVQDRYLCSKCENGLRKALRDLPDLLAELATTAYRQDRLTVPGGGGASGVKPLPFKTFAARLLAKATKHVFEFGDLCKIDSPSIKGKCVGMIGTLGAIAKNNPEAGRIFAVLTEDATKIRDAIDLPKTYVYLGQCDDCGAELYAERGSESWTCRGTIDVQCEAKYDLAARMIVLIERARQVVAPVATISTALTSLDMPVTEERIRKWSERGLITPRATIGRKHQYLVGDVIDLVVNERERQATGRPKR